MGSLKCLVSGSVNGAFVTFFERITKVNDKSGPFDMVLVAGSFFSDDQSKNSEWFDDEKRRSIKIPNIPFYILGPSNKRQVEFYNSSSSLSKGPKEGGFEISENITFLGKQGFLCGSSGLQIAYLSGFVSAESSLCSYNDDDVRELLLQHQSSSRQVDILLTSQPPKDFEKYLEFVPPEMKEVSGKGAEQIGRLAYHFKPRYHFCGDEFFFERRPYRNHKVLQESNRAVTRLLCLANVDNVKKQKWLYAFNITPTVSMERIELVKQPDGTTENPYSFDEEWQDKTKSGIGKSQFFYDQQYEINQQHRRQDNRKRRRDNYHGDDPGDGHRRRNQDEQQPSIKCWFCLASPDVEKHLIASIGDSCYLALPKGGLVPEHCMIVPIDHFRSLLDCVEKSDLLQEVAKYKDSLNKYFHSKGLAAVFFERNYRSFHFQVNAIPIPKSLLDSVDDKIQQIANLKGVKLKKIPPEMDLSDLLSPGVPYFYFEIPDIGLKLFTKIDTRRGDGSKPQQDFSLQLGREILADRVLLNLPDKIDWKECSLSKDEETDLTKKFKSEYKSYDFTL